MPYVGLKMRGFGKICRMVQSKALMTGGNNCNYSIVSAVKLFGLFSENPKR